MFTNLGVSKPDTPPVFSRRHALDLGLPRSALETHRVDRHLYGYYSLRGSVIDAVSLARAVASETPHSFVSHQTASLVHGIELPAYVDLGVPCVSRERGSRALRLSGVRSCEVKRIDLDTILVDGVPTSTPARVFLELARELSHSDLVALGDQLVRIPRERYDARTSPHAELGDLHTMLRAHPRAPGVRLAAAALRLVRVGADSSTETQMRLAVIRSGLPEPQLQVLLDPQKPEGWSSDLGYPVLGIALQYDGESHLDPERQYRDNARDGAFSSAGWIVIKANRRDLANGFSRIITELRQAFTTRGARVEPRP